MANGYLTGKIGNIKLYKGLGLSAEQILRNFNANASRFSNLGAFATGGNISYANGYRIHTFTSTDVFDASGFTGEVEYLIVAGGGGGGMDIDRKSVV